MLQILRLSAPATSRKPLVLADLYDTALKCCTSGSYLHSASFCDKQRRSYSKRTEHPRPGSRWNSEYAVEASRLRDQGLSIASIARWFQLPYNTVWKGLNNHYSTPRPCRESRWTPEDVAEVLRLRDEGLSIKSIAERLQLPYLRVMRRIHRSSSGKARPEKQWSPEDVAEMLRLRGEGLPIRSIADRIERSYDSVRSKIYELPRRVGAQHKPWQQHEIERLRKIMGQVVETDKIQALAAELGRSITSVKEKLKSVRRENNLPKKPRLKSSGKPWTQDEFDRAQHLVEEGKTWEQIGVVLGRSPSSVRLRLAYAKDTGKPFNPDFFVSPSELRQIQRCYCEGKSAYEIHRLLPHRSRSGIFHTIKISFGRYEEPAFRGEVKMP